MCGRENRLIEVIDYSQLTGRPECWMIDGFVDKPSGRIDTDRRVARNGDCRRPLLLKHRQGRHSCAGVDKTSVKTTTVEQELARNSIY